MMMIRGCSSVVIARVRWFSTIRGSLGPVRYNPQQGARRERREEAKVSQSRPLQRWKRLDEEKTQENVERDDVEEVSFASSEMQRLKAEVRLRDSSPAPISRERIRPVAEEEEQGQCSSREETAPPYGGGLFYGDGRKFEGVKSEPSRKLEPLKKKEDGLFYGDEGVELESLRGIVKKKKNDSLQGLFYGDGRKFEGVIPSATDLFHDPFIAAEDKHFGTEEVKTVAKEKEAAKNYALRLLAMAPQTAHKLRQKLIGRNVRESVIESTVADLQRCGLQSDLEYAEAFARSRWRSSLWGPQRLKQELRQRGVSSEDIQAAVEKVFRATDEVQAAEDPEDEGEGGRWGMTREVSDHLWAKARLQWRRGGSSVSKEARKRRMVGWLQRRGFNWSITSAILKALEVQDGASGVHLGDVS